MKLFYVCCENGEFKSEDGKQRYQVVKGRKLYEYLQTPEGKAKYFFEFTDENGDEIGVEAPEEQRKNFEQQKRRERYVRDSRKESNITIVSLESKSEEDDDLLSGEEIIADEDIDVVAETIHKMDIETLRRALTTLSADEYGIIQMLFLADEPLTIRECAKELSIGVMTVQDRKKAILKKLKEFF